MIFMIVCGFLASLPGNRTPQGQVLPQISRGKLSVSQNLNECSDVPFSYSRALYMFKQKRWDGIDLAKLFKVFHRF